MLLIATKLLDAFGLKVVGGSPAALDNLLISLKGKFVRIDHFRREHQNHHCNITVSPKNEKSPKITKPLWSIRPVGSYVRREHSMWAERETERSGLKIEWAETERWAGVRKNDKAGAERGAGASWNGNGAVSGLNWPLKFRSKVICYWNFAMLYKLYLSHVKTKLSTGILVPIGLFCFSIPISMSLFEQLAHSDNTQQEREYNWHKVVKFYATLFHHLANLSVCKLFIFTVVISEKSCLEQNSAWFWFASTPFSLNCTKFGKLIFRKIIKMLLPDVIFYSKMYPFRFRVGPWGTYRPLAGFIRPTSEKRERRGKDREGLRGIRGKGRQWMRIGLVSSPIFGLKVTLPILQYFAKISRMRGLASRRRLWLNFAESEIIKREWFKRFSISN